MELWTRALSDLIFPPASLEERYKQTHPSSVKAIAERKRAQRKTLEQKLKDPPVCQKHGTVMEVRISTTGRHYDRCVECLKESSKRQKERLKEERALKRRQTAASLPERVAATKYGKNVNELRKLKGVILHEYET